MLIASSLNERLSVPLAQIAWWKITGFGCDVEFELSTRTLSASVLLSVKLIHQCSILPGAADLTVIEF